MRGALLLLLLASSTASAERHRVWWVGPSLVATATSATTDQDAHLNGGARVMLSFEDAPIRVPGTNLFDHEGHIVPELIAGLYLDGDRLRTQVGAGLRAELQFSANRGNQWGQQMRMAMFAAARAKISGPGASAGAEFVIGEYLIRDSGTRFGFEGGLGILKRPELGPDGPELEAIANVLVGF